LLNGEMRSAFAKTEPDVGSSDATNIHSSIRHKGNDRFINGRKRFIINLAHAVLSVGAARQPSAGDSRQPSWLGLHLRRDLPDTGRGPRHRDILGEQRSHDHPIGRDRQAGPGRRRQMAAGAPKALLDCTMRMADHVYSYRATK
jgi:alkylation response protein AidB-like acyl-CoA dehydrogenase